MIASLAQDPTPTIMTLPVAPTIPDSAGGASLFVVLLVLAVAVGARMALDPLDRARIRDHVARSGGRVADIRWQPTFWSGAAREYEVDYATRTGEERSERCLTTMVRGVEWIRARPPA